MDKCTHSIVAGPLLSRARPVLRPEEKVVRVLILFCQKAKADFEIPAKKDVRPAWRRGGHCHNVGLCLREINDCRRTGTDEVTKSDISSRGSKQLQLG